MTRAQHITVARLLTVAVALVLAALMVVFGAIAAWVYHHAQRPAEGMSDARLVSIAGVRT